MSLDADTHMTMTNSLPMGNGEIRGEELDPITPTYIQLAT